MDILTAENLRELINVVGENLITIYMPTHPYGREQQQDPIRFRNLLTQARNRLEDRGFRKPDIEVLLQPTQPLLIDNIFWQHQSEGLALFIAPGFFKYYRQPMRFEELLFITEHFYIKPLLPYVSLNEHFYIMTLSQDKIRLLHGDRYRVTEVKLDNEPTSMREVLQFDDFEPQLQFHTRSDAPRGADDRPAIFHGQGATENNFKTNLLRYFTEIDKVISRHIQHQNAPVILAGVGYLIPIYRQVSKIPGLLDQFIEGNPDQISEKKLHEQGWKLVEPVFNLERNQALDQFRMLSGSGSNRASTDLSEIVKAAFDGRISVLFAEKGKQIWGIFEESKNQVEIHHEFQHNDIDLLDLAVVQTFLNRGSVFVLEPEAMPDQVELAAIYRYPL